MMQKKCACILTMTKLLYRQYIHIYNIFIVYKNFAEYEYLYKYEIFAKLLLKFK